MPCCVTYLFRYSICDATTSQEGHTAGIGQRVIDLGQGDAEKLKV